MNKYIFPIIKWKIKPWLKYWLVNRTQPIPTPVLPSDYQQVDYIESSGTQYIDTGYTPTLNSKIETKFNYGELTDTQIIFGCKNTSSQYYQLYKSQGKLNLAFGLDDILGQTEVTKGSTNVDILFICDKNNFSINGTSYNYRTTPSVDGYNSLGLFARHNPSDWTLNSAIKMYYFKIYDNDTLVRDFIPCYRKSDNVVGLYDLVNKVFYTNAGTGEFVKGGDV